MGTVKNFLVYTNPLVWPVAVGILGAALIAAIFGGVYQNVKKINSKLENEDL